MHSRPRSIHRGFTIVEMLVVVGIIAALLALLFPALGGMKRNSAKRAETTQLKQVHYAWMIYSTHNNDAVLPGYLEKDVQQRWRPKYEYADETPIPPGPNYAASDPNITGPWTWRLMKYLDYSHEIVRGYDKEEYESVMIRISTDPVKAEQIAREPAFGYNGYYVGGYWRMVDIDPADANPATGVYDFYNHCEINNPNDPNRKPLVIPTKMGQISRSDQLITFCSSTEVAAPGVHRFLDDRVGSALVMPPRMGTTQLWNQPGATQGGVGRVETLVNDVQIPLGRYTGNAAVLYADGHIDVQGYDALVDMRKWVDNATWELFDHDVCP